MRVVTFGRIEHAIPMCKRDRPLSEAFEHEYIESAALD
jgi:hypothetical protein